ncbi:M48 family metalloprotease [Phenylobacterium sp.]|uniref:M48 family metalloprotease n=1 Tax=Phenylobacterium sp. TaxID=1871053 RepID=UPI0025CFC0B7|nr:M48 family metalloprotease [Phenylobacterium sp.]
MRRFAWIAAAWAAAAGVLAAGPAAGQPAREHREMIAELGGVYLGPQADYVQRIGERMAEAAGMRQRCVFTVVDSEVVNAFTAPPGCYVYITRGLLGLVNSEAELAAVLGHELGHVASNHAIRQQNTEAMGSLAAALIGAATKSNLAGKVAGRVAKLGALGYSRSQEYEADSLALGYLPAAGYTPEGLTRVLDDLQREGAFTAQETGQSESSVAPWMSTHPLTSDRIRRATALAAKTPTQEGLVLDEASLLKALDGLPYGAGGGAQGYVDGASYVHPQLGIRFDAPRGFRLANESDAVRITGPNGELAEFAGGRATSKQLESYALQVLGAVVRNGRHTVGQPERTRINGLDAVVLPARATSGGRPVDLTVVAYVLTGDEAYSFVAMTPAGEAGLFDPMFDSFRRLSEREAQGGGGRKIAVVEVRPGDTAEAMSQRMAPGGDRLGRFLMLNALDRAEALRPGSRVKLVLEAGR